MISESKKSLPDKTKNLTNLKDDSIAPKGKTNLSVEPEWPTKASTPVKKKRIRRTEYSRLP